jgi:hypothetical protein
VLEDGNDHIIKLDELGGGGDLEASLLVHLGPWAAPDHLAGAFWIVASCSLGWHLARKQSVVKGT